MTRKQEQNPRAGPLRSVLRAAALVLTCAALCATPAYAPYWNELLPWAPG